MHDTITLVMITICPTTPATGHPITRPDTPNRTPPTRTCPPDPPETAKTAKIRPRPPDEWTKDVRLMFDGAVISVL